VNGEFFISASVGHEKHPAERYQFVTGDLDGRSQLCQPFSSARSVLQRAQLVVERHEKCGAASARKLSGVIQDCAGAIAES
jgi:hypothetical protein